MKGTKKNKTFFSEKFLFIFLDDFVRFGFEIFWRKKLAKSVHKMLMKLTPENLTTKV